MVDVFRASAQDGLINRADVLDELQNHGFTRHGRDRIPLALGLDEAETPMSAASYHSQRQMDPVFDQTARGTVGPDGATDETGDRGTWNPPVTERIVDSYVLEGRFLEERIVDEHFVVGVKPYRTIEKIIEVPQVVVKEVTRVVKRPEIIERIVEKPKIQIEEIIREVLIVKEIEKIVEVPQVVYEEKIVNVPKIIYEDRVVEIPKVIYDEHVTYEDRIEYREVIVDKIIEEVVTKQRTITRRIEKPIPMYMQIPKDVFVHSDKMVREMQEVNRTEEVPKITFQEFPVRKKVPVPVYRMVFPDGTKRIVKSIPGYPDLPRPKSYLEENMGLETDQQQGMGFTTRRSNLGVNPNLVNTTRPPPRFDLSHASTAGYRPGNMDETVSQFNMIPSTQAFYASHGPVGMDLSHGAIPPHFR